MLHRSSDPQSSVEAAADITPRLNQRCQQFLRSLRALGKATAKEAAVHACPDDYAQCETIRRRASDLHRDGFIIVVGRRRCKISGKPVSVYEEVKR
ncbi:MAG: hypothetical protein ACK5YR_23265 [Pirellula sp.]|jgi:hypothetical protein